MMPAVSKLFSGDNAGIKIKEQILVDVIQVMEAFSATYGGAARVRGGPTRH